MTTENRNSDPCNGCPAPRASGLIRAAGTPTGIGPENILVTGGAGYIGSHICKALAKEGHSPVVLDNLVAGHRWAVRWGPLIEGDIADAALVRGILKHYRIRAVIHCAAYAYVGESMHKPGRYFQNNVSNTLGFVDTLIAAGVRRLVFSSSCATYGEPHALPIDETHPQCPINPYGESKLFIEKALHWYAAAHDLRFMVLRYFNAAGADPDGEIGEAHHPETHLIPLVIETALGRRPSLRIFGDDYETPDGTAVRDYVHVRDLAEAHVHATDRLLAGRTGCALNLGTGNGLSVHQIVQAVERLSRRPVCTETAPRRPGDPARLVAAAGAAERCLGWNPRYSDLDTIVSTALRWHVENIPPASGYEMSSGSTESETACPLSPLN